MATMDDRVDQFLAADKPSQVKFFNELQSTQPEFAQRFRTRVGQRLKAQQTQSQDEYKSRHELNLGSEPIMDQEASFGTQWRVDSAPTVGDRAAKLKDVLPEGAEVRMSNNEIFFRPSGEEKFRPYDKDGLSVSGVAASLTQPEVVADVAASFVPGGPLIKAARTAAVAGGGRAGTLTLEDLQGYNSRSLGEDALDVGIAAAGGGVGELGSTLITGGRNAFRGDNQTPGSMRRDAADRLIGEEGLPPRGFGQSGPGAAAILRGRLDQFSDRIQQESIDQGQALEDYLQKKLGAVLTPEQQRAFAAGDVDAIPDEALISLDNQLREEAIESVRKATSTPARTQSMDEGGRAVEKGMFDPKVEDSYRSVSGARLNRLHSAAGKAAAEDVFEFDMSPALKVADDLEQEFIQAGQKGPVIAQQQLSPKIEAIIKKLRALKDGRVGNNTETTITQKKEVIASDGERMVVEEEIPFTAEHALQFVRTMRQDLSDFFGSNLEISEADEAAARRLWGAFNESIDNPIGGGERFRALLKRANLATARQHKVLDDKSMLRLARTDNGASVVNLIRGGSLDFNQVQTLRRLMPKDRWSQLQGVIKDDLIMNPEGIQLSQSGGLRLGKDTKTMDLVLSQADQASLLNYKRRLQKLDNSAFSATMKVAEDYAARSQHLMRNASVSELRDLTSSLNPEQLQGLRVGVLEGIISGSKKELFGQIYADPQSMSEALTKVMSDPVIMEKMRVVYGGEASEIIASAQNLSSWYGSKGFSKSGAGMAAGAEGGKMSDPTNPQGIIHALFEIRVARAMAWALSTKRVRTYLNQARDPLSESQMLRTASVLASTMSAQYPEVISEVTEQ